MVDLKGYWTLTSALSSIANKYGVTTVYILNSEENVDLTKLKIEVREKDFKNVGLLKKELERLINKELDIIFCIDSGMFNKANIKKDLIFENKSQSKKKDLQIIGCMLIASCLFALSIFAIVDITGLIIRLN